MSDSLSLNQNDIKNNIGSSNNICNSNNSKKTQSNYIQEYENEIKCFISNYFLEGDNHYAKCTTIENKISLLFKHIKDFNPNIIINFSSPISFSKIPKMYYNEQSIDELNLYISFVTNFCYNLNKIYNNIEEKNKDKIKLINIYNLIINSNKLIIKELNNTLNNNLIQNKKKASKFNLNKLHKNNNKYNELLINRSLPLSIRQIAGNYAIDCFNMYFNDINNNIEYINILCPFIIDTSSITLDSLIIDNFSVFSNIIKKCNNISEEKNQNTINNIINNKNTKEKLNYISYDLFINYDSNLEISFLLLSDLYHFINCFLDTNYYKIKYNTYIDEKEFNNCSYELVSITESFNNIHNKLLKKNSLISLFKIIEKDKNINITNNNNFEIKLDNDYMYNKFYLLETTKQIFDYYPKTQDLTYFSEKLIYDCYDIDYSLISSINTREKFEKSINNKIKQLSKYY